MSSTDTAPETRTGSSGSRIRPALRPARILVTAYLVISLATVVADFVLSADAPTLVNSTVWTRSSLVLLGAALTVFYCWRASRGSARAYSRLRLLTGATLIALVVVVALPGVLPGWLRIEQSFCGLLLLGTVAGINTARVRDLFRS